MAYILDRESSLILAATIHRPMTPGQISLVYRIPVVLCWRKVRKLVDMDLLRPIMVHVTRDGRTLRYFQATVSPEVLLPAVAQQA